MHLLSRRFGGHIIIPKPKSKDKFRHTSVQTSRFFSFRSFVCLFEILFFLPFYGVFGLLYHFAMVSIVMFVIAIMIVIFAAVEYTERRLQTVNDFAVFLYCLNWSGRSFSLFFNFTHATLFSILYSTVHSRLLTLHLILLYQFWFHVCLLHWHMAQTPKNIWNVNEATKQKKMNFICLSLL